MTNQINQEHEEVLNFAHSLPSGLTKEQIYVRIHERAKFAASADQAAGVVSAGYVLMPRRLTAENGAKSALMGEFKESIEVRCPDCDMDDTEECETCDSTGFVEQSTTIEWDTIKRIYARAVELLAAAPQPQAVQQPAEQAAPVAESGQALSILAECKRFLEDMHSMPADWTIKESQPLHAKVCAALAALRCPHCDGTGDVHDIIGEWLGACECAAGAELYEPAAPVPAASEGWVSVDERRPTDTKKKYWVASNWGVRMAHLHVPEWAKGEFQDALTDSDEGMDDWDRSKRPFTVTHWQELIFPAAPATCDKAEG